MTRDPERRTEQTHPVAGEAAERLRQFTLLAPGSLFAGRYRIEARIGGGGAGEVYRAFDELSQATVAIKVLFPRGDDPQPLERLRRELRLVRGLSHPGVVRIHDIGEYGGLLYLVMDLLQGETLRVRLKQGPLPPGEAAVVLEQVLEGLAAAHAAGVVHRDVKPGNILLVHGGGGPGAGGSATDSAGRAVLLDFGLARGGDAPGMTRTGAFLGTPEYVSPEQARAEKNVGPAADVYSAGIVLWEMLAGRPPFEGDSQVEVLMAHAQRPLPPPRRALAAAPGWLRDLAAWMLEKDAARRPADAGVALAFLRRRRRAPLVRRWRAAGRARGGTARRAAAVLVVLLLAAALAAAALLPARIEVRANEIQRRSLAGVAWPPVSAPFATARDVARVGLFRYALGLPHRPETPRDAPYMALFDSLRGEFAPFEPALWDPLGVICRNAFAGFSCDYSVTRLAALPGAPNLGEPTFAAIYTHLHEYPNLLVVFDAVGQPLLWLPSAGAVRNPVLLPAGGDPDGLPLLLVPIEFHDLGQRMGLLALPLLRDEGALVGEAQAPPYDLPVHEMFPQKPVFVTFTPFGRYGPIALEPGGRARLLPDGSAPLTFDARTGVPLDGPDAPDDPAAWLAAQRRLLELLEVAASRGAANQVGSGAETLERYAAEPDLSPSQRGTALGFAAVLRRRTGELDRALADTRAALEVEPEILGHRRMLIDLLARTAGWSATWQAFESFRGGKLPEQELRGGLVAAALLLGRTTEARTLVRLWYGGTMGPEDVQAEKALYQSLLALETGDFAGVESLLAPLPWAGEYSQASLAGAIAAVQRDPLDPAAVARWIEAARTGCGVKVEAPLVAVEALLAARTGRPGPSEAQLADALARQDAAGREHLLELLFARWARRLADESRKPGTATARR